jgi:hypothetical protein
MLVPLMADKGVRRAHALWWLIPLVGLLLGAASGLGYGTIAVSALAGVALLGCAAVWPAQAVVGLLVWLPLEIGLSGALGLPGATAFASDVVSAGIFVAYLSRLTPDGPERASRTPRPVAWATAAFLLAAIASLLWNGSSVVDAAYWLRGFLRFVPIALAMSVPSWRGIVMRALVPGAIAVGLAEISIAAAQLATRGALSAYFMPGAAAVGDLTLSRAGLADLGTRWVIGTTGHYNILGLLMVLLCGVYLSGIEQRREHGFPGSLLLWAMALGSTAVAILSQSRQGIVCLAAVWLFYGVLQTIRRRGGSPRVTFTLGALLVGVAFAYESLLELAPFARLFELGQAGFWQVGFAQNRGYVASAVLGTVLARSPVVGFGPGTFSGVVSRTSLALTSSALGLDPRYSLYVGDVGWVNVLVHLGLVGFIAVATITAWLASVALRNRVSPSVRVLAFSVAAVVAVASVASTPIVYKPTGVWLFAMAGVALYALAVRTGNEDEREPGGGKP